MNADIEVNKSASSVLYLEQTESDIISLEEVVAIFFKRLWVIVLTAALVFAAAILFYHFKLKDSYTSTATISLANASGDQDSSQSLNRELLQSEIQIIKSELIAKKAAESLGLHKEAGWVYPLEPKANLSDDELDIYINAAAQNLLSRITVEPLGRSYVLSVSATASTPLEAVKMANGISDKYLAWRKSNYSNDTEAATALSQSRIDELAEALDAKERELARLRADSGVLARGGSSVAEQRINRAENSFAEAKQEFEERDLDYHRAVASNGSWDRLLASGLVENTAVLNQLRQQQVVLNQELKELTTQYGDKHPDVISKNAEILQLNNRMEVEAESIVETLKAKRDAAQARMNSSNENLTSARLDLRRSNTDQVKIGSIEREIATLRSQYDRYVLELSATADNKVVYEDPARIVNAAVPALYSNKPSLFMFIALGSVLGVVCGAGAAVVLEATDDKFYGASSVWSKLNKRAVASVPDLNTRELANLENPDLRSVVGYAVARPMSAFAESIRVILSSIGAVRPLENGHVISITSSVPNEGKSTLSLSLGRVAAIAGFKVLLIDCDVRRRMAAKISGVKAERGIVHVLKGECTWKEAAYKDNHSQLTVIPAVVYKAEEGEEVYNLDTKQLDEVLVEMKEFYDLIILDGPPVLAMADSLGLAAIADTNLMVIRSRSSEEKTVQTAIRQINTATDEDNVAIVLNRVVKGKLGRVSYDDSLYYGYAEKNYYHD